MAWVLAKQIARAIHSGFNRHYRWYRMTTAGARRWFEDADWEEVQRAARERIGYYDRHVGETIAGLRSEFSIQDLDARLWRRVKVEYLRLLPEHRQPELAETYYNSVFCHLFHRTYYNNEFIFVWPVISTEHLESETPSFRCYYPTRDGFAQVVCEILSGFGFRLPFRDVWADVRNLTRAIRTRFPSGRDRRENFQLAVLRQVFYRNKGAYIIGKAINGADQIPFVIPILNDEEGGLYVDTLLMGSDEIGDIFSFSRAYFMVDTQVPAAIVEFLRPLMPHKGKAELYTAIGLHKFGKAEFYRSFLKHLHYSSDDLVVAPGIRGLVMCVFTLSSFPYVFKMIKDRFPPPKTTTREAVMEKYQLVKLHDRVGRMADSWEYSEVAFPRERFSDALLTQLREEAANSLVIEGDQVIIKHLYIERRMRPLNLYLETADAGQLRHVIREYGDAIKQLAAANIFPGDLLFKNFGVTRQGRVVFYDYDEICYLTECNFREIPEAPFPEMELADEPWYTPAPGDVFPEEFATFLLPDPRIRACFLEYHRELLDAAWWRRRQEVIRNGYLEDVFAYPVERRFLRTQP
ncbi:bifunctional isocitrate dehydrogenase kinase/phosphatase [Candidatus Thiosymbion oneisti]|uniref:bifunctional isocitrate dehydrogenase kinase/phosphatase n=1 Tax=Candidatus Thiosymbion oneisti TaxID=589554 RepID=UPI000A6DA314|nr:bifunctional isocitrate dehydrogenase kinase/phosphatase [Candidatus Thiosymbion oneisti]